MSQKPSNPSAPLQQVIERIKRANIQLWLEDQKLKFRAEKGAMTADIKSAIAAVKPALIAHLQTLPDQRLQSESPLTILPHAQRHSAPLSFAQQRLWIIDQLEDNTAAYNIPFALGLEGELNITALQQSLNDLLERHSALRTRINIDGETPQQLVQQSMALKLELQSITHDQLKHIAQTERGTPFDLSKGALIRAKLLQISPHNHVLLLTMHHIISDGWSSQVLAQDILAFCEAFRAGIYPTLPDLRIQYKDFAAWQQSSAEEDIREEQRAYWQKQLGGVLPKLNLPASQSRPPLKTYNGQILQSSLDETTTQQLRSFIEAEGGSLFMLLLSAWNVLFYRYTASSDIIIGTPTAGRDHADLKHQIGCYINTLALRNHVEEQYSFADFYSAVKTSTLDAYQHQSYPFDRLQEDLALQRDMGRNVLFDVLLVLQDVGPNSTTANALDTDVHHLGKAFSKFDLEITVEELEEQITYYINYNEDVYDREMVTGLMKHFRQLLQALLAKPQANITQVDFLDTQEKDLLAHFNQTQINYPKQTTILDVFAETVERVPEKTAVIFKDRRLCFRELEELSNQLAHYLKEEYQIQTEDLVALQLERSEWMLVAILGVLKSGAAYLPLDKDYPVERMAYIREDSQYRLCIDEEELEQFRRQQTKYSQQRHTHNITTENAAYAIYTSGSTGLPKGVVNQHGGLYNRLRWMRKDLDITSQDVLLQKTPYTFDVSVWELMMPLLSGSTLVFAQPDGHKDPDYLQTLIDTQAISIIHFVPSMLGAFLETIPTGKCQSLRQVVCSGEALPATMVEDFKKKITHCHIHNLYGPTEAAIDVTAIDLTDWDTQNEGVPIGKPVANTKIYITNKAGVLQPIGVPGELLITGIQVARGYLNRAALNQEKFIDNPFGPGKAYRTGDLVQWRMDGQITYLGRMDHQVKIRGNRVELGEIETVVEQHPAIDRCVVVVKNTASGQQNLLAYVVAKDEFPEEALSVFLNARLPVYMIPSLFIPLAAMPLNANGKIDRKALPDPDINALLAERYLAPRNETETELADIWAEVLQLERIGVADNFFQVGGDSIIAIRVVSRVNEHFGAALKVAHLYEHQTIGELGGYLSEGALDAGAVEEERASLEESLDALKAEILGEF